MPEELVEKTGWQILSDMFHKDKEMAAKPAPAAPAPNVIRGPRLAFNPLVLSSGDLVLLGIEDAQEVRFVVDRVCLMRRKIGVAEILSIDYVLNDPTDENIVAVLRALDEGGGKASFLLLRVDGTNVYNEQLETMLNATKPGSAEGFPRDDYQGFMRPPGAPVSHAVRVTEYSAEVAAKTYGKTYWDFVRDETFGYPPVYFFEMNGEDGFFTAYSGMPIERELVRAFRY